MGANHRTIHVSLQAPGPAGLPGTRRTRVRPAGCAGFLNGARRSEEKSGEGCLPPARPRRLPIRKVIGPGKRRWRGVSAFGARDSARIEDAVW